MGRETKITSDWPIHDVKGQIEPEESVRITFVRSYNRHFFKTEDMYISSGLLKKLIKEHGIRPKWKEYVEKTTPQGIVIKDESGKVLKEWINVDGASIDKLANGEINTK